MTTHTINAIQVHDYGDADQLKLEQIPQPEPREGEVLVRLHAAGVNPVDWKIRSGWMKDFRPMTFPYVPGADLAGVVAKVGNGVTACRHLTHPQTRRHAGQYRWPTRRGPGARSRGAPRELLRPGDERTPDHLRAADRGGPGPGRCRRDFPAQRGRESAGTQLERSWS